MNGNESCFYIVVPNQSSETSFDLPEPTSLKDILERVKRDPLFKGIDLANFNVNVNNKAVDDHSKVIIKNQDRITFSKKGSGAR